MLPQLKQHRNKANNVEIFDTLEYSGFPGFAASRTRNTVNAMLTHATRNKMNGHHLKKYWSYDVSKLRKTY